MSAASAKKVELESSVQKSATKPKRRRWPRVLLLLLVILLAGVATLGLWPIKADFVGRASP
jgi:hypothetical protein